MNIHEFDDIIKQKAQQREADVTADIWEVIIQKKKKRRIPFFWLITIMLLLGTSAIIWNMNSENEPVHTAGIEKTNQKENNISNNKTWNKNASPDLAKNSKGKTHDQSIRIINESPIVETIKNNTAVLDKNKKQQELAVNKMTEAKKEKSFSLSQTKRKIKGNTRMKIFAGEKGDLTDDGTNAEKIFSSAINKLDNNAVAKINIIAGESDSFLNTAAATRIDAEDLNKPVAPLKINKEDSLFTKKILVAVGDSTDDKKQIAITVVNSKIKNKRKNNNLKIETGFTIVFPNQQYNQPLFVKRVLDKTNIHSEFISDNIKTTMEAGSAFSVSLVKRINKKWNAGAGIQYLRISERLQFTGIETNDNYTIVQRVVNGPNGNFLKTDTASSISKDYTTLSGRNIYKSISIPLFIRYQILNKKKWSASFTTGIYIDLLRKYHNSIPGKFETVYTYGTESTTSKNTIGFDLFAGFHIEGKLSKKYEWFAEPSFRYNLSGYKTNNLSFNKKIHKPGLSVGITCNF